MNKATKIVFIIMVIIILGYILFGVVRKNINEDNPNENLSGEMINSGDSGDEEKISYTLELTSGENDITITAKTSGETTTTKYIFDNDLLSRIEVTEEVTSGEIAENMLESIKQDENVSEVYENIELKDNVITMNAKQEYVDRFSGFTKEQIYDMQEKAFNESNK